jgi:DNA polymerase-4
VTVTLKLRDSNFTTFTRQVSLEVPADLTEPVYEAALALLRKELHGQRIRLVGVTVSNFRDREQLSMFGAEDPKRHQAAEALDRIRRKYGDRAVTRARLVKAALPAPFERDPSTPVEHRQGLRRSTPGPEDRDSQDVTDASEDFDTDA